MPRNDLADYLEHDPFLEEPAKPKPKQSAETERHMQESDILRLVMEVSPNARVVRCDDDRNLRARWSPKGGNVRVC